MSASESISLTTEERGGLLAIARDAIGAGLRGEPMPARKKPSKGLRQMRGVFVTVKKHGELRGCMGLIQPVKPLFEATAEMAEAAAFRDFRFMPAQPDEFDDLELEISVLSQLERMHDISEVKVGESGLVVERGAQRGLLLPQVAVEHNWDARTFLEYTCIKAGLTKDAWEEAETEVYLFSAEVWQEESGE